MEYGMLDKMGYLIENCMIENCMIAFRVKVEN